jgi:hypothetical protein
MEIRKGRKTKVRLFKGEDRTGCVSHTIPRGKLKKESCTIDKTPFNTAPEITTKLSYSRGKAISRKVELTRHSERSVLRDSMKVDRW